MFLSLFGTGNASTWRGLQGMEEVYRIAKLIGIVAAKLSKALVSSCYKFFGTVNIVLRTVSKGLKVFQPAR